MWPHDKYAGTEVAGVQKSRRKMASRAASYSLTANRTGAPKVQKAPKAPKVEGGMINLVQIIC